MLARSNSLIFSIPVNNFDYRPISRSKEPEIFTFEQVPVQHAPLRNTPVRPRRKNTRVMYPANVRKYLPKPERSPAKRWLVILCLVVFLQIYTEEANVEAPTTQSAAESAAPDVPSEDLSFPLYQMLPFESAEQQARQMKSLSTERQLKEQEQQKTAPGESVLNRILNWTCPCRSSQVSDVCEQSRRNSYVAALLYPVYHRLGSNK